VYKIGELSKMCKIPVKTLRYYDSEGLLKPDEIDKFTGYRYYAAAKLADCNRILALKELGFTLEQIRQQINAKNAADVLALIATKEKELIDAKAQTESQIRRLSAIKEMIIRGDETMSYEQLFNIVIRNADSLRIAFMRRIFENKSDACVQMEQMGHELPAAILGKRKVMINYETEYTERDFDIAVGVELIGKLPKECVYAEKTINLPADVASLVCKQDQLDSAYSAMQRYLEENNCQIIGAFYEIFYDDDMAELKVPVCRLSAESDRHQDDDINIPFENDERVLGRWAFVDNVPSEEQFNLCKIKSNAGVWLMDLYFLPKGEQYWGVSWTKNYLCNESNFPRQRYRNQYRIKEINNEQYMFIEMKDYDHESRGGMPTIWVYKQIFSGVISKNDIRLRDDVNLPFVPDESILGKWVVRDFVFSADEFDPSKRNWAEEGLFFVSVAFEENGNCTMTLEPSILRTYTINWTKGILLDKNQQLAEHYEIRALYGKEYLFIEWKSGDYVFGGTKPEYYVFVRV